MNRVSQVKLAEVRPVLASAAFRVLTLVKAGHPTRLTSLHWERYCTGRVCHVRVGVMLITSPTVRWRMREINLASSCPSRSTGAHTPIRSHWTRSDGDTTMRKVDSRTEPSILSVWDG